MTLPTRDRGYVARLIARLESEGLSLLVLSEGQPSFQSRSPGVVPLLELVDRFPDGLKGTVVVDLVVGLCAARIFVHLRAGEVIAGKISKPAHDALTASNIPHSYLTLVPEIINESGTGPCPFEMISQQYTDPIELVCRMRTLLSELRAKHT